MLTWFLITLLVAADRPLPNVSHTRHVRPLSNIARAVVNEAINRSATIAGLIGELERLDVVVYVDVRAPLAPARGSTTLLSAAKDIRYISVALNVTLEPLTRMELLAHELQHALEIARADDVRDFAGMRRLYQAIGWELRTGAFETSAAIATERKVRLELGAPRPKPRPILDHGSTAVR